MLPFNGKYLRNIIIIEFYYILISIKASLGEKFLDLKKLSLYDSYFIILDTGLYLYDFNNFNCSLIYQFNNNEYRGDPNNKIILTELYYTYKAYIFCLVNEYLFLYSENTYKLFNYKIEDIINLNSDINYNIMPYKIENNKICFIFALNKDRNLFFSFYNLNLGGGINKQKEIAFNNMNIQNNMIRCQINSNSTFIICFYYSIINNQNKFFSDIFYINDLNLERKQDIKIFYNETLNEIKQIKLAKSFNDNFFVCISNNGTPSCFINNFNENSFEFNEIGCKLNGSWNIDYKVFFFNETNDFILLSRNWLSMTILNNLNNSKNICHQIGIFSYQENEYSLIYINGYKVLNYSNFSNYCQCNDISLIENNKHSENIKEFENAIDKSNNNEELIFNLNELIKSQTTINYIDENKEIIISKEEMTIAFTSTYIQKMNENTNSTTINLKKCEKILKYIYNISEESYLYLLKIDKKQEGKNFPLIEYEVFYPLSDEKIEKLNLSFCEETDIELSIPIIINDTIDKYNPKSNYYNDICSKSISESNTDIPLNDRRNEFINNDMSLCEDNCELTDYYNYKAKCSCNVKPVLSLKNIEFNKKDIMKNFIDIKKITNIEIIKCYGTCLKINYIKKNFGFIFVFFIFILYIICLIIFYSKSLKNLVDEIIKIISVINNKEYQVTNNGNISSIYNNTHKIRKRYIQQTNLEFGSTAKRKTLILKNNKRKTNNNNKNWKLDKTKDKLNKRKKQNTNILEYTDSELNSLSYKVALKKDKRTYCQYYCSLLKKKQPLLFSFYPNKDYNSQIIKIFLFFFFCLSDITINALFFTDETMHKIYIDSGSFNLNYHLPQIIYSYMISSGINFIIEYFSISENSIILIKSKKNITIHKKIKIISNMKIKFCFFFIVTFILLLIFWSYISCFCCIYENTQIHLIKDSLLSLGLSSIIPFFINLIPGIFRIPALRSKNSDKSCIYKLSQIIEFI